MLPNTELDAVVFGVAGNEVFSVALELPKGALLIVLGAVPNIPPDDGVVLNVPNTAEKQNKHLSIYYNSKSKTVLDLYKNICQNHFRI